MLIGVYYIRDLPPVAKQLVCTESATGAIYGPYPKLTWSNYSFPLCSSCALPPSWALYNCNRCEEYFVKNFHHPGFCFREPMCWDCLEPTSYCHHCMDQWNETMTIVRSKIVPPLKVRPKVVPYDANFDPFQKLDFG